MNHRVLGLTPQALRCRPSGPVQTLRPGCESAGSSFGGNSAFAALAYDGLTGATNPSYSGSSIESNTLWTSSDSHFDLGISVGTRAWFGAQTNTGTGATVKLNTTGSLSARVDTGIAVSGMLNATVQSNTLTVTLVNLGACPSASVGASVSAGYASGSIQSYSDLDYNACVGH